MSNFAELGLSNGLVKTLANKGYASPTPIQTQAIPVVLKGGDLLGIAQTGTGKTAAFALPILQRLSEDRRPAPAKGCRALILSPTRELATQIADSFRAYGKDLGISVATVFGGVKAGPQIRALAQGIDVLVATPGRLIDHLNERVANLSATEIFVLDEADQMLDMGFIVPIRRIVKQLPKVRQNLFFSATMPSEIGTLAGELLKSPATVSVTPQSTPVERIGQQVLFIEAARKRPLLADLFADNKFSRVLVFTRTKRGADRVARYLEAAGIPASAIHGDKSQAQRERALASFKAGKVRALVATDIAARGIDIDSVTHVINYELPNVPEAYVHRIGRTARAGADGSAITLCADDERNLLRDIQRVTRQTIPSFDRRNDKELAAQAAVADKLAPAPAEERHRDPRRPPAALRRQRPREKFAGGKPTASTSPIRNGGQKSNSQKSGAGGARDSRWTPLETV